jgi:DNA-binding transcriptional regulator YdaS (Cro superfamily)
MGSQRAGAALFGVSLSLVERLLQQQNSSVRQARSRRCPMRAVLPADWTTPTNG